MKKGIRVYNLYPKLVGSMEQWITHFDRIQAMNFDWIYLNPFHLPGFSGSDYAVKDYYNYHPLYVTGEPKFDHVEKGLAKKGHALLKKVCQEAAKRNMHIMMDAIINHTASDSPLTKEHPNWYLRDEHGKIKHPGALKGNEWIAWGDLAHLDNANSPDRQNLWNYWLKLLLFYADLGIRGFRCDAAYQVPSDLWRFLIPRVKEKYPDTLFFGETLGCQVHQLIEVAQTGFDLVANSFKWWNLKENWFLEQYRQWGNRYLSLTFPENHDTVRFAEEFHGKKELAVMKYALCAYLFSSAAITIGFEYGFRRKIDVVQISPAWWEPIHYDISKEIAEINKIKMSYQILQEDNIFEILQLNDSRLFGCTKESLDRREKIMLLVNPERDGTHGVHLGNIYNLMGRNQVQDISHGKRLEHVQDHLDYNLAPGEVKLLYAKR